MYSILNITTNTNIISSYAFVLNILTYNVFTYLTNI